MKVIIYMALGQVRAEQRLARQSLGPRLNDLPGRKLEYLTAVAVNGGRAATGAIAATLARTPQDVSWLREELIRDGDIYSPNRGHVALAVPVFARFLLANYEHARGLTDTPLLPLARLQENQHAHTARQTPRPPAVPGPPQPPTPPTRGTGSSR